MKLQSNAGYAINQASDTFDKVPGLTMSFYHAEPLLFKVQFEGKCYSPMTQITLFLRLMINDYVLHLDKFAPNTADRYKYLSDSGDLTYIDHIGGYTWYAFSRGTTTCAFSDIVYLDRGLHVFDLGARGRDDSAFPINILYGVFRIESIQYDSCANIGMTPMNVTVINSNG